MNILVTGATGFVGEPLVDRLVMDQYSVSAVLRNESISRFDDTVKLVRVEKLTALLDWTKDLEKIDTIIHLAGRAHVINDEAFDPLSEYRYINVECTLNLARQAAKLGVKRFIYMSSIKVNGESSEPGKPFTDRDIPKPQDYYGISKYEAELGLREIASETGMELVILRPPLIYGPGVKGNFLKLMGLIFRSVPLPLGLVNNQRSLVALDNLIDLIIKCINHPLAVSQIFLVSDDEDLSTKELCIRIGVALGRSVKLVPVPVRLIYFLAFILGRRGVADRLCSSLQVDISKTKDLLGWAPSKTVSESLSKTILSYLKVKQDD